MTTTCTPRYCSHCLVYEAMPNDTLCEPCLALPKCEVCEVFLDGLVAPSKENPDRCDSCLDFEEKIKFKCHICSKPIALYLSKNSRVLHYIVRGNACGTCNSGARASIKEGKEKEDRHQFIGYLAIIEKLYNAGAIGKEEWEYAIRRNRHDVTTWDGLDESLLEDEEDEAI